MFSNVSRSHVAYVRTERLLTCLNSLDQEDVRFSYAKHIPINTDHLNLRNNPELMAKLSPGEKIVFSIKVSKKNRFNMWQARSLMLTTENLCNLMK